MFFNGLLKLLLAMFTNVVTSLSSIQKVLNVQENANTKVFAKMVNVFAGRGSKVNFVSSHPKL